MSKMLRTFENVCILLAIAAVIFFVVTVITGCGSSRQQNGTTDTVQHDVFVVTFTASMPITQADGTIRLLEIPIAGKMVRDGSVITKLEATSATTIQGPELGPIVQGLVKQFLPAVAPFMGQAPSKDWTAEVIGLGSAGLLLAQQHMAAKKRLRDKDAEIEYHKADAEEGWNEAKAVKRAGRAEPSIVPPSA